MATLPTRHNFPPWPPLPKGTHWTPHKYWALIQKEFMKACIAVIRLHYDMQAAGFNASPATTFLWDNVLPRPIFDEAAALAMLAVDAYSARSLF